MTDDVHLSSGTTQPILCCIGQNEASSPTQFLLERAISATQLDWRAITAEVAVEDLAAAVAGMAAMKFMAVRFYPSLQSRALSELDPNNELLRFVGAITSASRAADGWHIWHHWGLAMAKWAAAQIDLTGTICWLHGDSIRCRSLLAALHELASGPSNLPTTIVWSNPPTKIPQQLHFIERSPQPLTLHLVQNQHESEAQRPDALEQWFSDRSYSSVLFAGDSFPTSDFQFGPGIERWLVVGGKSALRQAVARQLPQLSALRESEQIVLSEAYDFLRWTGCVINPAVLQDAYDEYCDF